MFFLNITEIQLLNIFREEGFTVQSGIFKNSDFICFLIEKKIAAIIEISEVTNVNYKDNKFIKIDFHYIFEPDNRPKLVGKIRSSIISSLGNDFENELLNGKKIDNKNLSLILEELDSLPNALGFYLTNFEHLLEEAEENEHKKNIKTKKNHSTLSRLEQQSNIPTDSTHSKAQFLLKEIGSIVNCDTWMASNDKNRHFNGVRLGENCLELFPEYNISQNDKKRIGLIDTIWLKNDIPTYAFEVEYTSSVYSGILRMADFITVIPNNINLYIIAPENRKNKVMNELNRPVFKKIGLSDYCKFISIERLEILYQKIKGLDGHIQPSVIDVITENASDYFKTFAHSN